MREEIKRDHDKIASVLFYLETTLKVVRDVKANSKSTTKQRLTKLEKHMALCVELSDELVKKYKEKK